MYQSRFNSDDGRDEGSNSLLAEVIERNIRTQFHLAKKCVDHVLCVEYHPS